MDNPKLRSFLKFLFPASIFFVCGVLGFATKNDPSPVLKTVELMAILGAFGYLIYRIAPKPETRKALFRVQDLAFFATVYVGALLATFVVTDKWQPVRVLESLSMIYVGMVILLLLNKIKLAWLMMVLKFTGMFIAMAGFSYLLTPNISWITVIIWSIILPLMNLANSKKKSEPENPAIPEDAWVTQGIAKF